jgi:RNA polymerase sigma-70 factor (ECF subfamily)
VDQRRCVERARRGDHDAFAELATTAFPRLTAVAQLILRDRELARDAVQETLIGAWRDLPGLRDPDRFDAWLHRQVVRKSLNAIRRKRRRVIEVEMSSLDVPAVPDTSGGLADRELVEAALRRLPPEGRALIVLHYYLGLSLPEAADTLGIPLGTAKSRLHRSLATMRAAIGIDEPAKPARIPGGQPV